MKFAPPKTAFEAAWLAVHAGIAEARALWILIDDEHERDGFWLAPMPWEGPGNYQAVYYRDGRAGLVRVPGDGQSLPTEAELKRQAERAARLEARTKQTVLTNGEIATDYYFGGRWRYRHVALEAKS
jgi:hypothetical protein